MEKQDQPIDKKRKMLLALPVLVLPFVTLMFWALGGGSNQVQGKDPDKGFNAELPGANNKEEPTDKMGFYTQAEKDALELEKEQKRDPYYQMEFDTQISELARPEELSGTQAPEATTSYEPNEQKVYQKLNALQAAINRPQEQRTGSEQQAPRVQSNVEGDLDRLEQMMQQVTQSSEQDGEMKQVNDLMERLLDLQHPERVEQRLKLASERNRGNVFGVSGLPANDPLTTLSPAENPLGNLLAGNGFYGLDDPYSTISAGNIAIKAVIHGDQTLVNGSTVKLRLLEPVYINGINIPKDQFIFGTVKLDGERLTVEINSIRYDNRIFPVELNVYDMDGMLGIYIPGAISRDVAKQGGERAIQGLGMTTLDPSLGAQAASAGMEITRNLLSKKVKLVKVMVKAGYRLLLVDAKQNKLK